TSDKMLRSTHAGAQGRRSAPPACIGDISQLLCAFAGIGVGDAVDRDGELIVRLHASQNWRALRQMDRNELVAAPALKRGGNVDAYSVADLHRGSRDATLPAKTVIGDNDVARRRLAGERHAWTPMRIRLLRLRDAAGIVITPALGGLAQRDRR